MRNIEKIRKAVSEGRAVKIRLTDKIEEEFPFFCNGMKVYVTGAYPEWALGKDGKTWVIEFESRDFLDHNKALEKPLLLAGETKPATFSQRTPGWLNDGFFVITLGSKGGILDFKLMD